MEQRKYRWMHDGSGWMIVWHVTTTLGEDWYEFIEENTSPFGVSKMPFNWFAKAGPYIEPPVDPDIYGDVFSIDNPAIVFYLNSQWDIPFSHIYWYTQYPLLYDNTPWLQGVEYGKLISWCPILPEFM
jgi:hypothetical protein